MLDSIVNNHLARIPRLLDGSSKLLLTADVGLCREQTAIPLVWEYVSQGHATIHRLWNDRPD